MLKVDDYIQSRFNEFNIEAWVVSDHDEFLRVRLTKFADDERLENFVYVSNIDRNVNLLRAPTYELLDLLFKSPKNKRFYYLSLGW